MNLQTILVRNNYSITLATLNVDGREGLLSIKQTSSQARTDTASVIVKLEGEAAIKQKISTMLEWDRIKEYLSEFYVNCEYIQEWRI